MFGRHVTKKLSAYAHGELTDAEAARVAEHLSACARCRGSLEEINFGIRLAESLPPCEAPAAIWDALEAALSSNTARGASTLHTLKVDAARNIVGTDHSVTRTDRNVVDAARSVVDAHNSVSVRARRKTLRAGLGIRSTLSWRRALVACSLLVLLASAVSLWLYRGATRTAWEVASLAGTPTVGRARVEKNSRLTVGEWLETDANSRAQLSVANIGQVEIDPGTRLRIVETKLTEHRIELAHGRMSARIWAPPRLFFVDTPSAVAADLGCAYTLEVDDTGRSLLHVTSGWVALEAKGRESLIPAGASCATQPGAAPGTPFFEDASRAFVDALARFDFSGGGADALAVVLKEARGRDTLTLWNLLTRTSGEDRARVYERLAQLAPPPTGVTRDGTLSLDQRMLDAWKDALEAKCFDVECSYAKGAWRNIKGWLWKHTVGK
jgi:anti-sigma factor RsiW